MASLLASILIALTVVGFPGWCSADAKQESLYQYAQALTDTSDCISRVGVNFARLTQLKFEGYDLASAKRLRDKLSGLSANIQDMLTPSAAHQSPDIGAYLKQTDPKHPDEQKWETIRHALIAIILQGSEIIDGIRAEKSEFLTSPAYVQLELEVKGKTTVMSLLQAMDAPTTPGALLGLKRVAAELHNYKRQTDLTVQKINTYLQTIENSPKS